MSSVGGRGFEAGPGRWAHLLSTVQDERFELSQEHDAFIAALALVAGLVSMAQRNRVKDVLEGESYTADGAFTSSLSLTRS